MVNIAILGYGTVGSGVVEVIEKNKKMVNQKAGEELNIKYILDIRDFPGDPYEYKVVHDADMIIGDADVAIICETMGGVGAAYQFTRRALERGKSVCTSNKELVAAHGPELLAIARENQCNYLFEASVGGGIPIIRPLNYSLTAERIEGITGILNGTTNYILSKMEKEGADFDDVLREAQEKGYAERNPEADVEGHDACRKIAILSSLMLGKNVDYQKIYTEGITKIAAEDFVYAKALGMSIKLLAISKAANLWGMGSDGPDSNGSGTNGLDTNGLGLDGSGFEGSDSDGSDTVQALVAPFLIGDEHPLKAVNGVFNAICVRGNMLGDSMYYGRGAGKLPTASAVVSDVIDCARHKGIPIMCFWAQEDAKVVDIGETKRKFFVRAKKDASKMVRDIFPDAKYIEGVSRSEDFGFLTGIMKEKEFEEKRKVLGSNVLGVIRVEG